MSTATNSSENVGVAFGLVIGAGASTCIGASVVFFPSLVKYASRKTLAAGLGLSAGVMTYVSFVEIFGKSVIGFLDYGEEEDMAYIYATCCFFGGVFLMVLLNFLVHRLLAGSYGQHHHHDHPHDHTPPVAVQMSKDNDNENDNHENDDDKATDDDGHDRNDDSDNPNEQQPDDGKLSVNDGDMHPVPPCCAHDPAAQLEKFQAMSQDLENLHHEHDAQAAARKGRETEETEREEEDHQSRVLSQAETKELHMMSLNTAIAIGLHNFPEGLATFVAALADPSVGVVLAVAIAIHNIPEGLCVALPVYYATGNRCKAFMWACISGASEPLAAVLGWAVLAHSFSDQIYGILFGLVAGMMVIISVRELLPTAHRYDPEDSVVTFFFMFGMAIMALSLVLFKL